MKAVKLAFLAAAILGSISSSGQTADELVDKYLNAIGGKENLKKINSFISTGSMQVQGADVTIVSTVLQAKGNRQDIMVMGMNGYTIVTPTAGWTFMPWTGQTAAEEMPKETVAQGGDQIDAQGPLVDYKSKGHTVEFAGREDVNGVSCYKLKINYKGGKQDTWYLDPTTYYLLKSVTRLKVNGTDMEQTTTFSNYQKQADGYVVPMSINVPLGMGINADLTLSKVEYNKPVDESVFKP
ncbi:hypothetical protein [Flavihumibacter petaseus]|uniref:Outer membrane lipoprotein-sorting protein n=1 Tax=Flavihumibacter petaseus NBRC 106054 TaxID=1220578 RepID=A0A0E9MVK0_9BACT|nr:hypothetical protein [Flavihumibacter petaseus]GAO41609.1 hypothetical protein FPE01S_01_06230 [Flavihumibacter petaseus NBRC 106054]